MENLKTLLTKYAKAAPLGPTKKTLSQKQLREDLLEVSNKNKSFFYIGTGMLVLLFITGLILTWLWHQRPELVAAVFGAAGISFTGIISKMFSYWKEKTRTDMLLALLGGTDDEETLKTVIAALVANL